MLLLNTEHLKELSCIPHLEDALACLDAHADAQAPARFEFEGGYLMLQEGDTRPVEDGDFEAHRSYLDVQVILEGAETIVWADLSGLTPAVPYDVAKDKEMLSGTGTVISLRAGQCYICWPYDGHKACRHADAPSHYRKAVLKLEYTAD